MREFEETGLVSMARKEDKGQFNISLYVYKAT